MGLAPVFLVLKDTLKRTMSKSDDEREPSSKKIRTSSTENPRVMQRMRIVEGTMQIIQQKLKKFEANILNCVNSAINTQIEQAVINALQKAAFPATNYLASNALAHPDNQVATTSTHAEQSLVEEDTQSLHEDLDQEWTQVTNNKRKNQQSTLTHVVNNTVSKSQNFLNGSDLPPNTPLPPVMEFPPISIKKTKNINSNLNTVNKAQETRRREAHTEKAAQKPTKTTSKPIIAFDINQKLLRGKLLEKNLSDFKVIRSKEPNRSIIIPSSKEVRDATIDILKNDQVNYFSYTPEEEKCSSLIIKHISPDYDENDVREEFERLGHSSKIASISPLKGVNVIKFNFFILRILPGVPTGEFKNIKYFLNSSIKIEKFIRTRELQCFRCQDLGHVQRNCHVDPKCVKCAQKHLSTECPIEKNASPDVLKCAFCLKNGHPASFFGCPDIKKLLKLRTAAKPKARQPKVITNPSFTNKNVSFAAAFRGTDSASSSRPQNMDNIRNILNKASSELFGCNYSDLKKSFDNFMKIYNDSSVEPSVKKTALLNFISYTDFDGQ